MSMKGTVFPDPGLGGRTRQSEKAACDVNVIVKQHTRGVIPQHVTQRVAAYGFAPAQDFRECMERVREAREVFASLPSETRKYFANDPARFVEFTADPKNVEKLVELKLAVPKEAAPGPMRVEVVNPPTNPPA